MQAVEIFFNLSDEEIISGKPIKRHKNKTYLELLKFLQSELKPIFPRLFTQVDYIRMKESKFSIGDLSNEETKVIGVCGFKRSGKDTISDYLCEKKRWKKISFADRLKKGCKVLFDLSDRQLNGSEKDKETIDERWEASPREILQFVGTDVFRNKFSTNFWVDSLKYYIDTNPGCYIISDVRFPNEVDFVRHYNGKIIKVDRKRYNSDLHESEIYIDKLKYDYLIENKEGLFELLDKVDKLPI